MNKRIYEAYIAEALRSISESAARISNGSYVAVRYMDIINPKPEPTETAEEIIDRISNKLENL